MVVATEPSSDNSMSSGETTISEKGRIFWVGNPFSIVLSWNTRGMSISSLVLKYTSHLVTNTPVSSSTKKDCARGSYQPIIVSVEVWLITWDPTTSVPRLSFTFLSWNSCLCSTLAFLTEIIFSWTVSKVPDAVNASSAIVLATLGSLSTSLVKVKTLVPVSNLGWLTEFGFGIKKLPVKFAARSETSLTLVTVASAPLVEPLRIMFSATYPLYAPCASFERENVSTFRIVDVAE